MGNKRLVIFDSKIQYAQRLVDYIENNGNYGIVLFTNIEKLENYIRNNDNEFYLLEDEPRIRQIISRYNIDALMLSDDKDLSQVGPYRYIYRYVPVSDVISKVDQLMNTFIENTDNQEFKVFSYVDLCNRMDIDDILLQASITTGFDEGKVIIFDFRYGTRWMLDEDEKLPTKLADVMYAARECHDTLPRIIEESIRKVNRYDVVAGLVEDEDVTQIKGDDIDTIIKTIISLNKYIRMIIVADYYLMSALGNSIAGAGIINVCRGSDKDMRLRQEYESRGAVICDELILSKHHIVNDNTAKLQEDYLCNEQKEVIMEFVKKGML